MALKTDSALPRLAPRPTGSELKSGGGARTQASDVARTRDEFKAAHVHGHGAGCGSSALPQLSPEQARQIGARAEQLLREGAKQTACPSEANSEAGEAAPGKKTVVDVAFHVISEGDSVEQGNVPQEMVEKQIDVLNGAFADAGFEFRLVTTTRTQNQEWFRADKGSEADREMKETLRVGGADTLNIYTRAPGKNLLGWATFPTSYKDDPLNDGVVLLHSTLPGGSKDKFNEGDTGTHEVGHWMGLFHTWNQKKEGDLEPTGDFVDDTPEHAKPNYGRPPETTDTLPDKPGFDPVKNFMNYVDDAWMDHFTPGQNARMRAQWELFRAGADEQAAA